MYIGGGAVGGSINQGAFYYMDHGGIDERQDFNWNQFGSSIRDGAVYGAIGGAVVSGISYGLSDAVQWNSRVSIVEYAQRNHGDQAAFQWAVDDLGIKNVKFDNAMLDKQGNVDLVSGKMRIGPKALQRLRSNDGSFSVDNLYETLIHERYHQSYAESGKWDFSSIADNEVLANQHKQAQHLRIHTNLQNHKYFQYWHKDIQGYSILEAKQLRHWDEIATELGY